MPRFLAVHAQAFTGDRTFCDWEAPSREAVEQVLKANNALKRNNRCRMRGGGPSVREPSFPSRTKEIT